MINICFLNWISYTMSSLEENIAVQVPLVLTITKKAIGTWMLTILLFRQRLELDNLNYLNFYFEYFVTQIGIYGYVSFSWQLCWVLLSFRFLNGFDRMETVQESNYLNDKLS